MERTSYKSRSFITKRDPSSTSVLFGLQNVQSALSRLLWVFIEIITELISLEAQEQGLLKSSTFQISLLVALGVPALRQSEGRT